MKHKEMQAVMFLNDHMIFAESLLSEREQAQLYAALRAYTMEGTMPDMNGRSKEWAATFKFMQAAQDKYIERYKETCERNRSAANKRWHNGSEPTRAKAHDTQYDEQKKSDRDRLISAFGTYL